MAARIGILSITAYAAVMAIVFEMTGTGADLGRLFNAFLP
jgi:hypothetical protein